MSETNKRSRWIACFCTAGILMLAAISLLTSRYGWRIYLELFSHFQLQYFCLALTLLVSLLLTRCRWFVLAGLFGCAAIAAQILPWYVPPASFKALPEANLRVLVANVNTQNRNYDAVLSLVRREQPDVAAFLEVDRAWIEQLNTLNDLLPHGFGRARSDNFGIAIYTRQPLIAPQLEYFGTENIATLLGRITVGDRALQLVATHPLPPVKPSFFHSRNRQLDLMAQALQTSELSIVLLGDLNATMWSPYYRRFSDRTGLKNARRGFGILPTWPTAGTYSQIPAAAALLLSIPIDHCLLSPSVQAIAIRTGENIGSDHRPLIADLHFEGR